MSEGTETLEIRLKEVKDSIERHKEDCYRLFKSGMDAGRIGFIKLELQKVLELARLEKDCRDRTADPFDSDYVHSIPDLVAMAEKGEV